MPYTAGSHFYAYIYDDKYMVYVSMPYTAGSHFYERRIARLREKI